MSDGHLLTRDERDEYNEDLIAFCDGELDQLGDIRGLDVLYAGGAALLWIEGLSQRIGETGSLTALELDPEKVEEAKQSLPEAELGAPVRIVSGDAFEPPFEAASFDLIYSAGMFHELDVREEPVAELLKALIPLIRAGGRLATGDFIDNEPAVQVEEERLQNELIEEVFHRRMYDIGGPERLVDLHEEYLSGVNWNISPPRQFRHLDRLVLAEDEPMLFQLAPTDVARNFRGRWENILERIRREGYTRPATLYVEGFVSPG